MAFDPATAVVGLGRDLIARIWPDPEQQQRATMELARLESEGELDQLKTRMSAIVMEAKSADPWTSRARPSFLYVMYVMILTAIPMGMLYAYSPETAAAIAEGSRAWLGAIPSEMWALFGAGYLGYVNQRSNDKATQLGKEVKPGLMSKLLG